MKERHPDVHQQITGSAGLKILGHDQTTRTHLLTAGRRGAPLCALGTVLLLQSLGKDLEVRLLLHRFLNHPCFLGSLCSEPLGRALHRVCVNCRTVESARQVAGGIVGAAAFPCRCPLPWGSVERVSHHLHRTAVA